MGKTFKTNYNKNKFGYKNNRNTKRTFEEEKENTDVVRLNKYLSNSGLCSRREADKYIARGFVKVNGKVVTQLGTKINLNDIVKYKNKIIRSEKLVYVLINKPKNTITSNKDETGRKTVIDLLNNRVKERVYPVGRLDRNTTGVLILTNDGELTKELTHPKYNKKKIYHAFTNKDVTKEDLLKLTKGFELEDGFMFFDAISYVSQDSKNELGIEIHSGRNRIIRRMFEYLGYEVVKLDRVYFAGLTKKSLKRGRWRYLAEREVGMLKMKSYK